MRRRWAAPLAATAILALAPASLWGQGTPWQYDQDVHLQYEFDDNVNESTGALATTPQARAQVAKVAYRGDLRWSGGDNRLSFNYHGGYKRHFGVVQEAGDVELDISSQFVNEAGLTYQRRLMPDVYLSGQLGLKDRRWTEDDFFFINEDAFRRYNGSVSVIVNLAPLDPERSARLEVGGRYRDIEFDNLDPHFGNWSMGGHLLLTKEFGSGIETRASYSYDRVRFPGRGVYTPRDTDPTNIIRGVTRPRQEDGVHDLGLEVQWFGEIGIVGEYRYRYNDSNSFGFTYQSHNFGLQMLRQLPWGLFAQLYGQVELRNFNEPVPSFTGGSLDIGEAADNVLLFRLVKDITPNYSVEAQYARYRNESITLNDFYSKNIYAVGMSYRP